MAYPALKCIVLEAFVCVNYLVRLDTLEWNSGFPAWFGLGLGGIGVTFLIRLGYIVRYCRRYRTNVGLPLLCDFRIRGIPIVPRTTRFFTIYVWGDCWWRLYQGILNDFHGGRVRRGVVRPSPDPWS